MSLEPFFIFNCHVNSGLRTITQKFGLKIVKVGNTENDKGNPSLFDGNFIIIIPKHVILWRTGLTLKNDGAGGRLEMDLTTLNVGGQSFIISMFVWPFSGSPQGLFFASKWRKIFKLDLSHWIYQNLVWFWISKINLWFENELWINFILHFDFFFQILKGFAIRLTSLTLGYYFKV